MSGLDLFLPGILLGFIGGFLVSALRRSEPEPGKLIQDTPKQMERRRAALRRARK